jgi:ABC-type nitrate/sulfonate/bicarbonate transport system permease component
MSARESEAPRDWAARQIGRWLPPLLLLVLGLCIWEAWVRIDGTPAWFLPSPSSVARTIVSDRDLLAHHTWVTLREVIVGFLVALVVGVCIAVAIEESPLTERALYPLIVASQAIPIVALAPLLLVWFGYGLLPKVIVTALVAFFPIVVTTVDGLRSADREMLELLRAMGAGAFTRFRLVKVPSAMPSLFSGMRIGIAIAVIGAVFGEYVGAKAGLGYLMNISSGRLLTARVFACIVVLACMAVTLFASVILLERLLLPWRRYVVRVENDFE